jgi:predicted nucleotidyltransferase
MDSEHAIRFVAERLGTLTNRMVFLGGASLGLLITDSGGAPPRPTKDVDLVVEMTMREYLDNSFRSQLLERGFREVLDGGVICRWAVGEVTVDIMPSTGILGFSNRWYPAVIAEAQCHRLPGGPEIRLISPACFLATKLEAFANRGRGDYQGSHDLEDVVAVLDGRPTIEDEIRPSSPEVRDFVAGQLAQHLATPAFTEALPGHLPSDSASQSRLTYLIARIERISQEK